MTKPSDLEARVSALEVRVDEVAADATAARHLAAANDRDFSELVIRVDANRSVINALGQQTAERFDGLETRFDGLETRFDGLETRFDGLETRFDGLETRFDGLETRFDQGFAEVGRQFEQIDGRFEQIDGRFEQIDGRFEQVDSNFDEVRGKLAEAAAGQARIVELLDVLITRGDDR